VANEHVDNSVSDSNRLFLPGDMLLILALKFSLLLMSFKLTNDPPLFGNRNPVLRTPSPELMLLRAETAVLPVSLIATPLNMLKLLILVSVALAGAMCAGRGVLFPTGLREGTEKAGTLFIISGTAILKPEYPLSDETADVCRFLGISEIVFGTVSLRRVLAIEEIGDE